MTHKILGATTIAAIALLAGSPCAAQGAKAKKAAKATAFARAVTTHVVLHELGHALVREFDLPVLGNEETLADAFATHYLTAHLPDQAPEVLLARVRSLLIEAKTRDEGRPGEHNSDARRAFQIAALAVAADAERYASVAKAVGMSKAEVRKARDYGSEIHRSWRRVLQKLWMPTGSASSEARVQVDGSDRLLAKLCDDEWIGALRSTLERFDWHSQVTLRFVQGDGGAGWNRSKRSITVNSDYVRRFLEQGKPGK